MRNAFADTLYQLASKDSKLAVVVADISPAGSMEKFRREYPDRFINTGCAEQIMIGLCAGMAIKGLKPFAYTIATFALYRPFEFVRDDICYQNLPVTIVGIGGGLTYSNLGGTHHAMEDIAIATALPNMTVSAPCDPLETRLATEWCAKGQGPVYLRLGKSGEPNLTENAEPFEIGKIRYLTRGTDGCIFSYGPIMAKVLEKFKRREDVSIISCHTLKPLDVEGIEEALNLHKQAVVIEEHVPQGGLGAMIKAMDSSCLTYSLKDKFIHTYGTHDDLLQAHDLI